jgi:hypothetical protein
MAELKVTEVPAHTGFAEGVTTILTGRSGLTVITTGFDNAGLPVAQVAFEISTQVRVFPFAGAKVWVGLVAPVISVPFNFHWYKGAGPPLTRPELNVTSVPAQTGFAEAVIAILAGSNGLTVMVILFEVAGLPVTQVRLEVNIQVTTSLVKGI